MNLNEFITDVQNCSNSFETVQEEWLGQSFQEDSNDYIVVNENSCLFD